MKTQSLQEYEQDLQAIDTAIEQLSLLEAGTVGTVLAIRDTIESFRFQRLVTQRCIDELTWANSWQARIDSFHSDGGVYEEEVA